MRRLVLLLLVATAPALAAMPSCADATQLRLVVKDERVDCTKGPITRVYSGPPGALGDVPKAETKACVTSGVAGDVVFTPSDPEAPVELRVEAKLDGSAEPCIEGKLDCIVARRRFGFVKRRGLTLSVTLDGRCAGVTCAPTETCFAGSCTSSLVTCEGDACTVAPERGPDDAGAADAGADGPSDGGAPDGAIDAPNDGGGDGFCSNVDVALAGLSGVTRLIGAPKASAYYVRVGAAGKTFVGRLSRDPSKRTELGIDDVVTTLVATDEAFLVFDQTQQRTTLRDFKTSPVVASVDPNDTKEIALAPSSTLGATLNLRSSGLGPGLYRGGTIKRCDVPDEVVHLRALDSEDVFFSGATLFRCDGTSGNALQVGGPLDLEPPLFFALKALTASDGLVAWANSSKLGVFQLGNASLRPTVPVPPLLALGFGENRALYVERAPPLQVRAVTPGPAGSLAVASLGVTLDPAAEDVVFVAAPFTGAGDCVVYRVGDRVRSVRLP